MLAARISYIAIKYNFLPKTHFKGQYRSCVKTTIHHLLKKIYLTWNENKVASFFIMAIFATYLNTSDQYLLRNLYKKRINI